MTGHVHPAHDGRPADLRPELGIDQPAPSRRRRSILAWGSGSLLRVEIAGQKPRASSATSCTTCRPAWRSAARPRSVPTCSARPSSTRTRRSSARTRRASTSAGAARRSPTGPIAFEGTLRRRRSCDRARTSAAMLGRHRRGPQADRAAPGDPAAVPDPPTDDCDPPIFDGMPEVEVFDRGADEWMRLPHPDPGPRYALAEPARYVDPATGTVLVRFVNDRQDGVGFDFDLSITGDVRVTAIVRTHGLVKRYDRTLAVAGIDLAVEPGEIFGLVGPERRRQDDDAAHARDAARPSSGRRRDRRLVGHPEPRRGPSRPRLHAGRVRGLRRHEGLGVPRLLRALLRHRRRPAGAG